MHKRQRKKWLKQHNKYVSNAELWNLDSTICNWILPRLKEFKRVNFAYPGTEEVPTPEAWDEILDKMIHGFEMAAKDPIDVLDVYDDHCKLKVSIEEYKRRASELEKEQEECLQLFAKYINYLWI